MKANPWGLVRAHYATLVDYRTGQPRVRDYLFFLGIPAVVLVGGLVLCASLPDSATAGLLTTSGLLAAFFFGVMLQIAARALAWTDQHPAPGPETSWQARFLEEIAANAGYASLVSTATAAVFVGATVAEDAVLVALSSLGLALAVHLVLMLWMVMARVFALTKDGLTKARTGQSSSAARRGAGN